MEYRKSENNEEIVLAYCPAQQVEEIELRYERELPECMRQQKEEAPSEIVETEPLRRVSVADELMEPKGGKRRSWITLTAILVSFALVIGGIGAGVWWIVDTAIDSFLVIRVPEGSNSGSGNSGTPSEDPDNGAQPDTGRSQTDKGGDPQFESYRPQQGEAGLNLVSVAPGRTILTAGEIYDKVAPSTVTIIGIHGETYSVGTGVIFTSDGYIITNHHVVAGCVECEVWVTDAYGVDNVYSARYVGGDEDKDLAVLKIEAQGLPAAEFGVSSDLSVGDKVYAIGNPLGTELRSTLRTALSLRLTVMLMSMALP